MYRVDKKRIEKYSMYSDDINAQDNIYYDVNIKNTQNVVIPAYYNKSEKTTIVDNPNDYYACVLKFVIPATAIPIFKFRSDTYYISSSYNGNTISTPVNLINQTIPIDGDLIYNYQLFVEMINATFRTNLIDLWTTYGPIAGIPDPTVPTNQVPVMVYTDDSTPIYIRYPDGYNEGSGTNLEIFFNYRLFKFFQNFPHLFNATDYNSNLAYQLRIYNTGDNFETITSGPYAGDYYIMSQDSPTFYLWWDIKDVIITTDLPIASEVIGSIDPRGDYKTLEILTDHTLDKRGLPNTDRIDVVYRPEAQYRLISLLGSASINNINFRFLYRTKNLELIDFPLYPNDNLYLKLLFVKKNLYN